MITMEKKPTIAIDIIIQDSKGRILLGKLSEKWRDQGKYLWGLPGREISFGENLKSCAERNLLDELGLKLTAGKIICVNSNFGHGNHFITVGILAKIDGTLINKHPDDWLEWKWFNLNEIPTELFPSAERTLKSFIKGAISIDFE